MEFLSSSLCLSLCLCVQVNTLGREVSDLGRVMRRMVQLMENLLPSVPQPSVVCPTDYSPAHRVPLPHPSPPRSYPSPTSSHSASPWTDTPVSLPSSPVVVPQPRAAICNRDFLTHRPQNLQPGVPASPGCTLPPAPNSLVLQLRCSATEPLAPSSPLSPPEMSQHTEAVSTMSREHSPSLRGGGDEGLHQTPGCSPQTGHGGTFHEPTMGL